MSNMIGENAMMKLKKPKKQFKKLEIPEEYYCPISHCIMFNPVMAVDGNTYEREEIETWLKTHDTSPLQNNILPNKQLTPNKSLKRMIDGFLEKHPELWKTGDIYASKNLKDNLIKAIAEGNIFNIRRYTSLDRRLRWEPIQGGNNLLALACRQKNPKVLETVIMVLGDLFWNQLMGESGMTRLFQQVANFMRIEGAKIVAKKFEWRQKDIQQQLFQAIKIGDCDTVIVCLQLGANLNSPDQFGSYAIHLMILYNQLDVLQVLKLKQINLELTNKGGNTALHLAAKNGDDHLVELLMRNGANAKALNGENQRPTEVAQKRGKNKTARLIESIRHELKVQPFLQPLQKKIDDYKQVINKQGNMISTLQEKFRKQKLTIEEGQLNLAHLKQIIVKLLQKKIDDYKQVINKQGNMISMLQEKVRKQEGTQLVVLQDHQHNTKGINEILVNKPFLTQIMLKNVAPGGDITPTMTKEINEIQPFLTQIMPKDVAPWLRRMQVDNNKEIRLKALTLPKYQKTLFYNKCVNYLPSLPYITLDISFRYPLRDSAKVVRDNLNKLTIKFIMPIRFTANDETVMNFDESFMICSLYNCSKFMAYASFVKNVKMDIDENTNSLTFTGNGSSCNEIEKLISSLMSSPHENKQVYNSTNRHNLFNKFMQSEVEELSDDEEQEEQLEVTPN